MENEKVGEMMGGDIGEDWGGGGLGTRNSWEHIGGHPPASTSPRGSLAEKQPWQFILSTPLPV